jgi:hypothetical protein
MCVTRSEKHAKYPKYVTMFICLIGVCSLNSRFRSVLAIIFLNTKTGMGLAHDSIKNSRMVTDNGTIGCEWKMHTGILGIEGNSNL